MKRRKWAALLCALAVSAAFSPAAAAADGPIIAAEAVTGTAEGVRAGFPLPPEDVSAPSFVVMECSTGSVAAEKEPHRIVPPASLAKMMTVLLTLEAIGEGTVALDDVATASEHACGVGGVEIWLTPGEEITVEELLIAVSMGSGNDAAVALAEHVSGSEETFVGAMNRKARQLGMVHTSFLDCSGYDQRSETCAYDTALLAKELLRHETASNYATIWMHELRGGETELVNTNRLVRFYNGCLGLKTGVSEEAGNCICAAAEREEKTFIAAAFGVERTEDVFEDAKALLDFAFGNFSVVSPAVDPAQITEVSIERGVKGSTMPLVSEAFPVLVPTGKEDALSVEAEIAGSVRAPVSIGQNLGVVRILLDGEPVAERPVVSGETVEEMNFPNAFFLLLSRFLR